VIDLGAPLRRRAPVDRSRDRQVVVVAIALAVGFLVAALGTVLLPVGARRGDWLPLHLALAGAATTAIAGVVPFFTAAFAAGPPADVRLRFGAVLTVALGALGVAVGVPSGATPVAAAGGVAFVGGVALTGLATVRPLRTALGPHRGIVVQGYLVALAEVGVGAILATVLVAGWSPVVQAWGALKPAHAWLNIVGFVSLVIATTLLHFFPTVVGARIAARLSARLTVLGIAVGPLIVAIGFAFGLDLVGRAGAVLVIVGAIALAAYARATWSTRGRWTTDQAWHSFAIGGLVSAIAWFEIGIAIAAGRVVVLGTDPAAWSLEAVAAPLVAGWVGLAILASATHLLPAVGPGDPASRARQSSLLGRRPLLRLGLADVGVAALAAGLPFDMESLVVSGTVLLAVALAWTLGLLVGAIGVAVRAS
jgi:nitrite reductase (NO-forming)